MVARRETELAARVVRWLENRQWVVSQECEIETSDVPDIVAERGPKMWAISAKLSFGIEVIEQAYRLLRLAHKSSVAVPLQSRDRTTRVRICYALGIGVLGVAENGDVVEISEPRMLTPHRYARIQTHPEQRSGRFAQAGSNRGGHFTEANQTFAAAKEFVALNPRCSIKQVVAGIQHHYSRDVVAARCIAEYFDRDEDVQRHGKASNAMYWIEES